MTTAGLIFASACLEHDSGPGHPEGPRRLRAIEEALARMPGIDRVPRASSRLATDEELELVHTTRNLEHVREVCAGEEGILDWDTLVGPGSWDAARHAAGAPLVAIERVLAGQWRRGLCLGRPPGHHAERGRALGFCLFNNVAIAAAALRERHGLERVAILDFDAHHGNGTQHLFEEDPTVFYASLHQWPHFPGTGREEERGRGAGEGTTLNCPLPEGSGDAEWLDALEVRVLPALAAFGPQFLLLSAGFDAHRDDPFSGTVMTEAGYRAMTRRLADFADEQCDGRLVSVLEGGYSPPALAASVVVHLDELGRAPR